nr:uncharacterized protein LOC123775122 isoform X1 [Procambarus clarkii]
MKVFVVFVVLCGGAGVFARPKPWCGIQIEGHVVKNGVCTFTFSFGGCAGLLQLQEEEEGASGSWRLNKSLVSSSVVQRPLDTTNSLLDLQFSFHHQGKSVVALNGVTTSGRQQCVTVTYARLPDRQVGTALLLGNLPLPHGTYNTTLFTGDPLLDAYPMAVIRMGPTRRILLHTTGGAVLPTVAPRGFPWEAGKSRKRRVGGTDLVLEAAEDTPSASCRCCYDCYTHSFTYYNDSGLLQLSYTVNASCGHICYDVKIKLLKIPSIGTAGQCAALDTHHMHSKNLFPITAREPRNVSESPTHYHNVGTGCYRYEIIPLVYPLPFGPEAIWLQPAVNITDMNKWNTTFYLEPRAEYRSLSVRWTEKQPYNFSHYKLELWYNRRHKITCVGNNIDNNITLIPRNKELIISSPDHTFHNLTSGYYCARVMPIDDRCDIDGCTPLSSHTRQLLDLEEAVEEESAPSVVPVVVGAAVVVMLAGIVVACCVLSRCQVIREFNIYTIVRQLPRLGDRQVKVLLVWTPYGPLGAEFVPVIAAFKKILKSYCRCQVYDYLDLPSLPDDHLQHLLTSPTSWIDTLLADPTVKIIVVGSEGAKLRQAEGMLLPAEDPSSAVLPEDADPHDSFLFPFLLRRLQDRPQLAGDYSRIFHVRFSVVSDKTAELDGIVSFTRYRLPEHLRSLTLSLHGRPEGCHIDEPSPEMLRDLNRALAAHPLSRDQNGHSGSDSFLDINHKHNGSINSSHAHNGNAVSSDAHNGTTVSSDAHNGTVVSSHAHNGTAVSNHAYNGMTVSRNASSVIRLQPLSTQLPKL